METKKQIRMRYRALRDALTQTEQKQCASLTASHILNWERYRCAKRIFCYYPLGSELSLLAVMDDALSHGRRLALPKVAGDGMDFYEITDLSALKEGSFHVMEPDICGKQPVIWHDALCFVPGLVFDRTGGRFGYGKGYYDRYFAASDNVLVGCAYGAQLTQKLPTNAWDKRMDYLACENGIYTTEQEQ